MTIQLVYKGAEVRLTQMIADLRVQPAGWTAVHFHLDRLLEEYRSEYQIKIALNLINDLLKSHEGFLFLMNDSSIIVLCGKMEQILQEKLIFQLRYLFMDDPLSYSESGLENPDFCTLYDVKHNWKAFNELCARYMAMVARRAPLAHQQVNVPVADLQAATMQVPAATAETQAERPEMNVSRLAALETTMRNTDLQAAIRRQPVCAVFPDMKLRRFFDELYMNMSHLRRVLHSDVDFLSNRWLFRYITQILDTRMIELIRLNPARYLDSPVSINFNAETLLSSRFSEFDATVPAAKKISIVLEVPVVDAFADMTAFNLAVSEARKLGYRVCLDGLTPASFTSIRDGMEVDLFKVQWNGELKSDVETPACSAMMKAVKAIGSNRVILCRCDTRKAIEFGHSLGISLFQGRFIDSVLNPTSKVEN